MKFRSDEDLVTDICLGSRPAFDEIYHRYAGRIRYFFLQLYYFDSEYASDKTQDVFLKLLENSANFDPSKRFSPWIFALAYNLYKNDLRRKEVIEKHRASFTEADFVVQPDAASALDRKIRKALVQQAMNQLDEEVKTIFVLRFADELTIPEIATVVGCAEGTVKSRLFYAGKKLSEKLKDLQLNDWI